VKVLRLIVLFWLMVLATVAWASTAKADPLDACPSPLCESMFLEALHEENLWPDPSVAISNAEKICVGIANGTTPDEAATEVQEVSDFTRYQAGYFVGASIAAFCPQYLDANASAPVEPTPETPFERRLV
jgi:hypothetical protein